MAVARAVGRLWSGRIFTEAATVLALGGLGTIFIDAAGTVDVGYTVRIPYALLGVACAIGAPLVVAGWLALPSHLRLLAAALLVVYALAALLGHTEVLRGQGRA